jgi:archaellin
VLDLDISSGASYKLTLKYSDENNLLSDIPRTISWAGNNNSDNILDNEEKAEITGWILDRDTTDTITANDSIAYMGGPGDGGGAGGMTSIETVLSVSDKITIEVITEGGSVLTIERKLRMRSRA